MSTIDKSLELFVLNIEALRQLRIDVTALQEAKPEAGLTEAQVTDLIDNYDFDYVIENAIENMDFDDKVESVIRYGYVDVTSNVRVDQLDFEDNAEFINLRDRVIDLEDNGPGEYESRIDELEEAVRELTSALDHISNRLDNARIDI